MKHVSYLIWGLLGIAVGLSLQKILPVNTNHIVLTKAVMMNQSFAGAEGFDRLTAMQARALAHLDPAQAEMWLSQGLEGNGRSLTYFELCRLYWEQGRQNEVVTTCQAGNIPETYWVKVGLQAEQVRDLDLALAAYETAVVIDANAAAAWFRLGHMRFLTQDYAEAISAYEQALAVGYPPQPVVYAEIGRAYLKMDELAAAKEAFGEGLRLFPDSQPLYFDMVSVAQRERKWQTANTWLADLLEKWPEDGRAWTMRGEVALQQNDPIRALTYYQRAVQYEPKNVSIWSGMAQVALKLEDIPQAAAAYEQIIALAPDRPIYWLQAGEFFLEYDQPSKAREAFEQVLVLEPTNQRAQGYLATLAP